MTGKNVGDDLKSMAQDVAELGAGYMRIGRRWLEMQRNQVVAASADMGEREGAPTAGDPRGRGPHGRRHRWEGRAGAGPDSFLDETGDAGYAAPGRTQSPFRDTGAGEESDYLPPGNQTFGRSSYRGVGPKNYTRSDQRITEDLCESLTRCRHVDPSDVSVNVSGGVVTLTGTVRERWMKHRIEDMAAECEGVRNVENKIHVPLAERPTEGVSAGDTTLPDPEA
ncbi:BON domain-containing protein [Novilysobacter antarcticus]|uniref:BON domain-containing protein n=1 Tax=Novilysobacter antarcticus TaxID=2862543 RepID=UPI001C98F18B|nr:BON domain-containing protein [Lysobacter antarcticus]